jgi:hypothetical protein
MEYLAARLPPNESEDEGEGQRGRLLDDLNSPRAALSLLLAAHLLSIAPREPGARPDDPQPQFVVKLSTLLLVDPAAVVARTS